MGNTLPISDRKTSLTRQAILDALLEVIGDGQLHNFSVQAVADAAGVAHRTVYRHFPNREALLEGLGEWLNGRFVAALGIGVDDFHPTVTAAELGRVSATGYLIFAQHAKLVSAYVTLAVSAHIRLKSRLRRSRWFEQLTAAHASHLCESDVEAVAAILRLIGSTVAWHFAHEHSGASPESLARAVRWAVDTLVADLAAGGGPTELADGASR